MLDDDLNWLVPVCSVIDGLFATLFLTLLGRTKQTEGTQPNLTLPRVLAAVCLTGFVFLAKVFVLAAIGLHAFGLIHLIYVDLVVLIPLIGLGLWLAERRGWLRFTATVRALAILSLALAGVGVYATFYEPFNLRLETATLDLPPGRDGSQPIRIGVLTDLQTNRVGAHEQRVVDLLMAQKPDLILLPGDVFQGSDEQFETTRADLTTLLARLQAPGGVFLVLGDTDGPGDHLQQILPRTSIRLLINEVAHITVNGQRLAIGGTELDYQSNRARRLIQQVEQLDDPGETKLILAHRPDVALTLKAQSQVDLVVAGHTHGGQIVVPGFGPPITLSNVPRQVAAGGLHKIASVPIYVSRGAGCERGQAPRIRFLCPPEVSILTLRAGQKSVSLSQKTLP